MESKYTLELTIENVEYKSKERYEAIFEGAKNPELSPDRVIKQLKANKLSKIILRSGGVYTIKEEGEEYKRKFKFFFKLIANCWYLKHVELQGVPMNSRFLKDIKQAISELGKTKKIELSFGI